MTKVPEGGYPDWRGAAPTAGTRRFPWGIWVDWATQPTDTIGELAHQFAESLRVVSAVAPYPVAEFHRLSASKPLVVADPGLARTLESRLRRARGNNYRDEAVGDVSMLLFPRPGAPYDVKVDCINPTDCKFQFECYTGDGRWLADDPYAVTDMLMRLAGVWRARCAWIDMVHVRQQWNRWHHQMPVYGWATWMRDDFARVDTTGLPVDVTEHPGGRLITLREPVVQMADSALAVGRSTIRELARRSVLADGRSVPEANPYLAAALAEG